MSKGLLILIILTHVCLVQAQQAKVAFTIKENDLIPEGIAFDQTDNVFFVGSIHKRKILRIDERGEATDYITSQQDGLGEALGLFVDDRRHLWICNNEGENILGGRSNVHVYDLNSKRLINKFEIKEENETHLFNDLTVTKAGAAFVTDSDAGAIYKISSANGAIELYLKSDRLQYCNGITTSPDESKLIVSTSRGLLTIHIDSGEMSRLDAGYLVIADGLYRYQNSLVAIQNVFFPVSIVQYKLNASFDRIEKPATLLVNHRSFAIPTTGAVVGNWFYFIANSQLDKREAGTIKDPENLKDVIVMKIKLN